MLIGLPFLLAVACGPVDNETNAYLDQLEPLLVENSLLAERVLLVAADIYNEDTTGEEVASTWTAEVVPLAEHLHAQAEVVVPPPNWAGQHSNLVGIWMSRADAYRDISIAVETGETERWDAATAKARQVKLDEEAWFRDVKNTLSQKGLSIRQYP